MYDSSVVHLSSVANALSTRRRSSVRYITNRRLTSGPIHQPFSFTNASSRLGAQPSLLRNHSAAATVRQQSALNTQGSALYTLHATKLKAVVLAILMVISAR